MQLRVDQTASEHSTGRTVSVEWLAYLGLALFSLLLRLSVLDSVPISDFEAQGALHAWHTVEDDAPGTFSVSSTPLTHLTQLLTFTTLGADEFSLRIGTALAGFVLTLTPLLFRDSLGKTRTFVWVALLTLLTIPIAASRLADGSTFMILFTVLAIWMIRRYWYSQQLSHAMWAMVFVAFMLLLSNPSGIPLLVILLLSGWLAVWRTALSAPQRLELPGDDILQLAVRRLREFPFAKVIALPIVVVWLSATLFMLNPAGLRTVSHLVSTSISGITQSHAVDGVRLGFAALLAYQPLLIIFALGGAWLLWKHGDVTFIDRFAAAWALVGTVGLLLYPGAMASDAMWVVLPLTLLASYGITQLMVNRRVVWLWSDDDDEEEESDPSLYSTSYWWVKWVFSIGVLFFLLIFAVQFIQVARLMLSLPAGSGFGDLFNLLADSSQARLAQGLGLLLMTAIIAFIIFLLVANFWGWSTCLQGLGIGFLWLMLLSDLGGAWQSTVVNVSRPNSLWYPSAVNQDAYFLRETFFDLADRETSGFPLLEVTVVVDQSGIIKKDGLVAWLLRDFPNVRFVHSAEEAAQDQIILMKEDESAAAALDGDYVGQSFALRRRWSIAELGIWDLPAWWSQGRLRDGSSTEETVILWLRQDVYDGIPVEERAR